MNWHGLAGRLRMRTVLLCALALSAGLPMLGTVFFRVYETTLVRQTEQELVQQAAYIRAAYLVELRRACMAHATDIPIKSVRPDLVKGRAACPVMTGLKPRRQETTKYSRAEIDSEFQVAALQIDMSSTPILPKRPAAQATALVPDPLAQLAAARIWPVIARGTSVSLAGVRIVDTQGIVIAGRDERGLSLTAVPEIYDALKGKSQSLLRAREGEARYALEWISRASGVRTFRAEPMADDDGKIWGAILLSRSPRSLFKGLYDDLDKIILAALAVAAIVLALALYMAARITRPIHALNDMTQRLMRGEKITARSQPTAVKEISQLTENFHHMADVLDQRAGYIRNFAAAVSHEFKTPLTSMRGAVELLRDHGADMDAAARQKFLNNLEADTQRLSVLVSRLMDLAKADMAERTSGISNITDTLDMLRHRYAEQGLAITHSTDAMMSAQIDAPILDTILSSLFTNAHQAGAKTVQVSARAEPDKILLDISDDGPGLAAADAARLFTPFFTTRRETGGTGLGLTIARALLTAHGGDIMLTTAQPHASFRVELRRV